VDHIRNLLTRIAALGALVAMAGAARAQIPNTDTTAPHLRLNTAALVPGQFVYQTTLERDSGTMALGFRTVSASLSSYAGSPAWLLVESRFGDAIPATDSLFISFPDLRPTHWASTLGGARLGVEFRGDSAFGGTTAPAGRRSMVAAVPAGTLVNAAMLETVLRLLPLQSGWEDSTTTLSVSLNGNLVLPTRLSVIGEDRIRVPAGTFDCWVVAVHADPGRGLYWVTKRDPIVVRSSLDVPSMGRGADGGGAQLISALTRISR
jgi:hypothetical protein